ncbi:MAG: retention module-containing protein, partial [Chlorobium sp.]|uniref:retention module-containing protein n=1 Tax=Chlorobium sp. TaxID=1095 RepID=UPI002F40ACC9
MSTINVAPIATVTGVSGRVWIRSQDGKLRSVKQGDAVYQGEVVVTSDGCKVELKNASGSLITIAGGKQVEIVSDLFDKQGAAGTDDNSDYQTDYDSDGSDDQGQGNRQIGHGFIRVDRIHESVVDPPYRFWSVRGKYIPLLACRNGENDAYLDGRATHNQRLRMSAVPLSFDANEAGYVLREFSGMAADDRPDYIPVANDDLPDALGDANRVLEGENTVTGNVLNNDIDGDGKSRVVAITYIPEDGGAPQTVSVPASGSVTVDTLYGQLTIGSDGKWSYLSDPNEEHGADDVLKDTIGYTISDDDGDTASASLVIDVLDTTPEIASPEPSVVDEDDLPEGNDSDGKESVTVGGLLGVVPGEDPIDTFFTSQTAPVGLSSDGKAVKYYISDDGYTLIAYTGDITPGNAPHADQQVFLVNIFDPTDSNGSQRYEFRLIDQLDHPAGSGENTMDFTFDFRVRDTNEGMLDVADGSFIVTVVDDVPADGTGTERGYVEEEALSGGNQDTNDVSGINGDGDSQNAVWQGSLSGLFSVGTDAPGSYGLGTNTGSLPTLSSNHE